MGFASVSP